MGGCLLATWQDIPWHDIPWPQAPSITWLLYGLLTPRYRQYLWGRVEEGGVGRADGWRTRTQRRRRNL